MWRSRSAPTRLVGRPGGGPRGNSAVPRRVARGITRRLSSSTAELAPGLKTGAHTPARDLHPAPGTATGSIPQCERSPPDKRVSGGASLSRERNEVASWAATGTGLRHSTGPRQASQVSNKRVSPSRRHQENSGCGVSENIPERSQDTGFPRKPRCSSLPTAWDGHPLTSALPGHGTTLPTEMASPSTEHRARDCACPLCLTRAPRPPDGTSRRVTWRCVLTALPPRRVPTRGGRVSSRPRHILPRPATVPRRGSARTLLATVTQPHGAGRPALLPRRRSARQTRSASKSRGWGFPEGVPSPVRPQ
ncbi:uncharacterized protein LOC121042271 [Herpailurus yagouaroundi]|uniref:uncharacterized protein LOC121042271 n=1 Tax=Herpailurus yagouaroundi TaxID=1608482 RepID=UPI001AD78725|nr:uncharacterized protein LOC121042271 [Puma yagouaroundi]